MIGTSATIMFMLKESIVSVAAIKSHNDGPRSSYVVGGKSGVRVVLLRDEYVSPAD